MIQPAMIQEYTRPDGTPAQIVRDERGRFLPGTQPPVVITSDTARDMLSKRYERAAERAADGMAAGVKAVKAVNPAIMDGLTEDLVTGDAHGDAWAILNAVTTMQALQSDKPQTDAMQAIGRNARMIQGKEQQADDNSGVVRVDIPADALMDLLREVRAERARRDGCDNYTYAKQEASSIGSLDISSREAQAAPADAQTDTAHTPTT